jgi:hypothetical protein
MPYVISLKGAWERAQGSLEERNLVLLVSEEMSLM